MIEQLISQLHDFFRYRVVFNPCSPAGDGAGDPRPTEVGPGGGDPLLLPGAPPAHDGRHRDRGRGRGAGEGQEDRRDHHHPLCHGVQVQQHRQRVEINR